MLLNAHSLELGATVTTRYCIVGSGMGGAAIAQRLAAAGEEVLLVEAGGLEPRLGDSETVQAEFVGQPLNRPPTRCVELGGTSNQWHGMCAPLDEIDFEPRPWIPHSGWPIRRRDLDRFYVEACTLHGLDTGTSFEPQELDVKFGTRLQDVQFDRSVLENKLTQCRQTPRRWKNDLVERARQGALRCLINAPALELILHEDGTRVDRLIVGHGTGSFTVAADTFVICTGTLETPRLLLNSRRRCSAGIGNDHDLVGRFLLDHPTGHFCKLGFARAARANLYASLWLNPGTRLMAGLTMTADQQRRHSLPNHGLWLRPSVTAARTDDDLLHSFLRVRGVRDLTLRQVYGMLTNPDLLYRVLVHRFGLHPRFRYADLYYFTEQLPNPNSRVTLSAQQRDAYGYPVARVDWQLTDDDFHHFESYARVLFEQGLRSPQYHLARVDDPALWREHVASAAHHVGTARMADHPTRGVVDRNLQVFGVQNLFIGDGSVFPTAGNANPSLTITALGLRLAEYLLATTTRQ